MTDYIIWRLSFDKKSKLSPAAGVCWMHWKDAGTSDFITGLLETPEKMAWMLRAHLK